MREAQRRNRLIGNSLENLLHDLWWHSIDIAPPGSFTGGWRQWIAAIGTRARRDCSAVHNGTIDQGATSRWAKDLAKVRQNHGAIAQAIDRTATCGMQRFVGALEALVMTLEDPKLTLLNPGQHAVIPSWCIACGSLLEDGGDCPEPMCDNSVYGQIAAGKRVPPNEWPEPPLDYLHEWDQWE
jgi:hypothetical protein